MESIEKLRAAGRNMAKGRNLENHEECNLLLGIADEIEAEIECEYMRLPVDADGVPIRVGDVLESTNAFKNWCVVMGIGDVTKYDHIIYVKFETAGDISQTWASKFIHRKPDAVKELLEKLVRDVSGGYYLTAEQDRWIDECAARIREAVEK